MNNSQNSDIFLENSMIEDSPHIFNSTPYKMLLTKTIEFLSTESIFKEPSFAQKFTLCLEDCCVCVCQCLELISSTVESTDVQSVELQSYLEDAVILLQKLSCFLKTLIETVALSCESLKTFPTTTGQIILNIFTHCKDSENLYGNFLKVVETELKDLFRTCHELQHTYLMILEKHFIFDMMVVEQQYILLKALDINLKISEIVQALDVKTMAEQLKAYTGICTKYSESLMDKDIYNQCTELLCGLIGSNLKTALEIDQEEKIVLRSLKIASFIIKILTKLSDIFKYGARNNYDIVLQTLISIYMCDGTIQREQLNKSQQFISQVNLLIFKITQELLFQLLLDRRFFDCLLQSDIRKVSEDKQHGLLLLLISTIKCTLQNTDLNLNVPKNKLIEYIFNIIPYGEVWLNSKVTHKDSEEQSLEDNLLVNLVALSMSLRGEEFSVLEEKLCDAVLGDNCSKALFVTHYWVLLAKLTDSQYIVPTVTSLCKIYENLELNASFQNSPQEIQLGQIIRRLFEILPNHYKVLVKKQYEIQEKYYNLWSFIKIKNLPENIRVATEENLLGKLLFELKKLTNSDYMENDMQQLIKIMKVASTCCFTELNSNIIDSIVKAWVKACPKNLFSLPKNIENSIFWYYSYVEALVLLTNEIIEKFVYFENVLTVFHIISKLILTGNNELILLLIPLYCKISLYFFADEPNLSIDQNIDETFKYLLLKTEPLVQHYTLGELLKYNKEKKIKNIVGKIINSSSELQKMWQHIKNKNINEGNKQWMLIADCKYTHKCMENKFIHEDSDKIKLKSNFEMDIDNLFTIEVAEEPASKKVKLEDDQFLDIVKRLENDSLLLSSTKHISDECKKRITVVCDRLRNIIT
ncbi:PREDICTED: uncharacterized protein C1orf112 homolog [Papilio xuthus]|uniref:Uncharacterized protein C1orf112 homolog n=1 Tax=Papilio xuthus TaxID=66420 RepID=A0AAJ6Z0D4_PAPXU|nr:PREDICTED: uncharacterized protein C1orf112 homolog [Papilio xuthus]